MDEWDSQYTCVLSVDMTANELVEILIGDCHCPYYLKNERKLCHGTYPDAQKTSTQFSKLQQNTSPVGLEPTTSGLEVRRAIHCTTETSKVSALGWQFFENVLLMCIGTTKYCWLLRERWIYKIDQHCPDLEGHINLLDRANMIQFMGRRNQIEFVVCFKAERSLKYVWRPSCRWSRFKPCSKLLVQPFGNHSQSLLPQFTWNVYQTCNYVKFKSVPTLLKRNHNIL